MSSKSLPFLNIIVYMYYILLYPNTYNKRCVKPIRIILLIAIPQKKKTFKRYQATMPAVES